jgi:RNA polymerase sigma factor (TIGR02999 family)
MAVESVPPDITELLRAWRNGDREALDQLVPHVYDELRHRAADQLRRERPGHSLPATAIVHEAFLRLMGQKTPEWQDRAHFLAVASRVMRQVLVDHARSRRALKRGEGRPALSLDQGAIVSNEQCTSLVALDDALHALARQDADKARLVEMRFFGGLSIEEAAEVMDISPATVKRQWSFARAWLHRELAGSLDGSQAHTP